MPQTSQQSDIFVECRGSHALVSFSGLDMPCDWVIPAEMMQVVVSHTGRHQLLCSGTCYQLQSGDVLLLFAGTHNALVPDSDGCFSILNVPLAELSDAAIGMSWLRKETLWELPVVCGAPELEQLVKVMTQPSHQTDHFREHIRFHQLQVCHGLILQLFHGLGCGMITTQPLNDAVVAQLRRQVLTNLQEDVDLSALAASCKVSVKTLYNRLRSSLDCTPGEFIRLLKIESVFRELSARPRTARNVTEVVINYGFSNLGRFAQHYRQHIGELPSETLRRSSS
ncbi:helix-turn-helix domain-containing protein [Oceanobacter antarcticus]|uniref:Helix-turn-helix domain-containing protein n=1 Tax=Oceanobacter antarcticus TaxID=3133425 RepID=A0ABW8NF61_9GAMM